MFVCLNRLHGKSGTFTDSVFLFFASKSYNWKKQANKRRGRDYWYSGASVVREGSLEEEAPG